MAHCLCVVLLGRQGEAQGVLNQSLGFRGFLVRLLYRPFEGGHRLAIEAFIQLN